MVSLVLWVFVGWVLCGISGVWRSLGLFLRCLCLFGFLVGLFVGGFGACER